MKLYGIFFLFASIAVVICQDESYDDPDIQDTVGPTTDSKITDAATDTFQPEVELTTDTTPRAEPETETGPGRKWQPGPESKPKPGSKAKSGSQLKTDSGPESESEPESEPEPVGEPEPDSEPEPKSTSMEPDKGYGSDTSLPDTTSDKTSWSPGNKKTEYTVSRPVVPLDGSRPPSSPTETMNAVDYSAIENEIEEDDSPPAPSSRKAEPEKKADSGSEANSVSIATYFAIMTSFLVSRVLRF